MIRKQKTGTVFYHWKIFEQFGDRVTIAITSRIGGVSTAHLQGLNLGHAVKDSQISLHENRKRIEKALKLDRYSWSVANQVHGCRISTALPAEDSPHAETDALYLTEPGVIAAVTLADCHPVILYDPVRNSGMICHAGWKGTAAGIADNGVSYMLKAGSRTKDLVAATGPGIGPCCYQVGEEVAGFFKNDKIYPKGVISSDPDLQAKWRLNIEAANAARLRALGLNEDNIGTAGFCTACRGDEFFSYRKEKGLTGRQVALMALLH